MTPPGRAASTEAMPSPLARPSRVHRRGCIVVELPARSRRGKRTADTIVVQADQHWLHSLTHRSYLGKTGPRWWSFQTEWLWTPPYSQLTVVQLGGLVRLVCMLCRSRDSYNEATFQTTRKELRFYGLSDHVLRAISKNFAHVKISLLTGTGEIRDL